MKKAFFFLFLIWFSFSSYASRGDTLSFSQLKRFIPKRGNKCYLEEGMPENVDASYCNTAFGAYDYPPRRPSGETDRAIIELSVSDCYKLNGCTLKDMPSYIPDTMVVEFADCSKKVYYKRKYGNHVEFFVPVTRRTWISLVVYNDKYLNEAYALFRKIRLMELKTLALNKHNDE